MSALTASVLSSVLPRPGYLFLSEIAFLPPLQAAGQRPHLAFLTTV